MKLKEIAQVRTGLVLARKASEPMNAIYHEYKQLNLKCIRENATIDLHQLDIFESKEDLSLNYLTKADDVIIRLVAPHTAVLIDSASSNIVVSSHFCMVRVYPDKALPAFVQWFLNSDFAKVQLVKGTTGTTIANVKPSVIGDLEIQDVGLAEQRKIGDAYCTGLKEIRLMEELRNQKSKQYKQAIDQYYKNLLKS